jgi:hypothetical protein
MSYLDLLKARNPLPNTPETVEPHTLPTGSPEAEAAPLDRPDLIARAEILITLYGPLRVESGVNGSAEGIVSPEALVRLYHAWPWGIISTQNGVALMKWGEVPESAWKEWNL